MAEASLVSLQRDAHMPRASQVLLLEAESEIGGHSKTWVEPTDKGWGTAIAWVVGSG